MPARARLGIARSFQITSVFSEFTALENVVLAVQAQRATAFRFWRPRSAAMPRCASRRRAALERGRARRHAPTSPAAELAHGERRQLELAMALRREPQLLLLDEPMAGMGPAESERMVALLRDAQGPLRHPAGRARHGRRVRARRPHHRAGLRPRDRHRRRRTRSAPTPRCAPPISATDMGRVSVTRCSKVRNLQRCPTARARCCSASIFDVARRRGASRCSAATAWASRRRSCASSGMLAAAPATIALRRAAASTGWPSYRIAQAGHRPRAGRAAGLPEPHRAREPRRDRAPTAASARRRGRSSASTTCSRASPSAQAQHRATSSRAASSRCSRSAAR